MSDFTEVMKQWRRMCKAQDDGSNRDVCATCPMGGVEQSCVAIFEGDMDYVRVEKVVTKWAQENPEPVYPAWRDWLRSQYPLMGPYTMTDILETPIPADIAQKLGIEPKEGT